MAVICHHVDKCLSLPQTISTMKLLIRLLACSLCIVSFITCQQVKKKEKSTTSKVQNTIPIKYAKGFSITTFTHYTKVTVFNPWDKSQVYADYYLVKQDSITTPKDGLKIKIPLKNLAINSSTHIEPLRLLGELSCVNGVCNKDYIYNPQILEGIKTGKIKNLGDSYNTNMEQLLLLHPAAFMTTAYNAKDENNKRLEQSGVKIIYNIEWQETNCLGRAEWMKFIAAFFDKSALADSIFNGIESNYQFYQKLAKKATIKPTIMSGQDFRGNWTMPAGQSFSNQLFQDANVSYYYANTPQKGSISTTIEEALIHFHAADIWIGAQTNTYKELLATNEKYSFFAPFQRKKVFNFNKKSTPTGGCDYWESGVSHPDRILADLIKIAHPELLPNYQTYYIQPLH